MTTEYEEKVRGIDLWDCIKGARAGPVAIGTSLNEFGEVLGVPKFWGFSPGEMFSAYMIFGQVEIHVRAEDSNVNVYYIKIPSYKSKRNRILFGGSHNSSASYIRIPPKKDLCLPSVKDFLFENQLKFSDEDSALSSEETVATIKLENGVRLYFGGDVPDLEQIEIW
ncbi:hypothetical protein AB4037_34375 [Labrys sp. KB_33_2]|uniref:hypothetical protein n=1 Tax=Labrys sp. KB_33_2 TaxID=3237479 RepID=UPI003F931D5C